MDFSPMVHWKKLEAVLDLKVPELRKDKKEKQQTHWQLAAHSTSS
jgi:hypothetical protein